MSTAPKPAKSAEPSLEELAARQGITPVINFDDLFGQGADLWDSDADFEQWLRWLEEIRQEGR